MWYEHHYLLKELRKIATATILVLFSAILHASWNFLSKRAGGGLPFIWLFTAAGVFVYTPIVLVFLFYQKPLIEGTNIYFILGSIVLHLVYFVILQKGYKVGDFSLVYPIARGLGPMLVTVIAILLFHERPSWVTLTGTVLIIGSVFFLTGGPKIFKNPNVFLALRYGIVLGIIIASYTLWDKYVVSALLIPPLLLDYFTTLGRFILLTPIALKRWDEVRGEWQRHRLEVIGIGILNSLAYILVLSAMVIAPVSYVAPMREVSILFGTILGVFILKEGYGWNRILAAGSMVIGVIAVVIGTDA